jgi:hypothetical protein
MGTGYRSVKHISFCRTRIKREFGSLNAGYSQEQGQMRHFIGSSRVLKQKFWRTARMRRKLPQFFFEVFFVSLNERAQ